MRIGILGAGEAAQAFGRKAIAAGNQIVFSNRRGPHSLSSLVERFGPLASAATPQEASQNPVVLLAIPWLNVEESLRSLPSWEGQILIDSTNGFQEDGIVDFGESSSSEMVAQLAPGARVVKAMNAIFMENFRKEPESEGKRRVIFVSGDDSSATERIADLFETFGFAPVLLGTLREGGRMQGVGSTLAGHDLFVPWPAPRAFPAFNGSSRV